MDIIHTILPQNHFFLSFEYFHFICFNDFFGWPMVLGSQFSIQGIIVLCSAGSCTCSSLRIISSYFSYYGSKSSAHPLHSCRIIACCFFDLIHDQLIHSRRTGT